jgi:hypothetical protein
MTTLKHQFTGEHEAFQIVMWLNSGQSAGRHRIAELVDLYNKLGKSARHAKECVATGRRLQELLDRYRYKYTIVVDRTIIEPDGKMRGEEWNHEAYCVPLVHRLRQLDMLARVRRCDGCKKWMFAKLPAQRFCSDSCRIKAYQSDQQWQARNNAKRRKTYHDNKLRKVRLLERRDEL